MKKICPILNIGRSDQTLPCIEERCAWWDNANNECVLKSLRRIWWKHACMGSDEN